MCIHWSCIRLRPFCPAHNKIMHYDRAQHKGLVHMDLPNITPDPQIFSMLTGPYCPLHTPHRPKIVTQDLQKKVILKPWIIQILKYLNNYFRQS